MEAELSALVHGDSVTALIAFCENFELDLGHAELSVEASFFVYKIHLAAYLLMEQLDNARFLWKRLPTEPRDAEPELCALWTVGKAMWVKDHAAMQSAITAFSWSPPLLELMMQRLQREHLARCFGQAVRAYSLVSAEYLSQTIGVPIETVHQTASEQEWTTDAETGAYVPGPPADPKAQPALVETLERLTAYVAHVEREVR